MMRDNKDQALAAAVPSSKSWHELNCFLVKQGEGENQMVMDVTWKRGFARTARVCKCVYNWLTTGFMTVWLAKCANRPFLDAVPNATMKYQFVHRMQRRQRVACGMLTGFFKAQWRTACDSVFVKVDSCVL